MSTNTDKPDHLGEIILIGIDVAPILGRFTKSKVVDWDPEIIKQRKAESMSRRLNNLIDRTKRDKK